MSDVKLTKKDEKVIDDLAKTKTVRELARVLLSYLTVEEMAQFIGTYMVFKSKDAEEQALGYFVKDQFFPLMKTVILALGDLIPDFFSDSKFIKLYAKLPKRFEFKKD